MHRNPYAKFVEGRNLVESLEQVPQAIERAVRGWPRARDEQSYAPGKWTARQILVHLAQSEMVFSNRLRFGLSADDYVIQPFDQDAWMAAEASARESALDALDAYVAVRRMNLALCRSLGAAHLSRAVTHPEVGTITLEWIVAFFAGHERNHLPQIETIGRDTEGELHV